MIKIYLCPNSDQEPAARLIINAGTDVNYKNSQGLSPICSAVANESNSLIKLLALSPGVDLSGQVDMHLNLTIITVDSNFNHMHV